MTTSPVIRDVDLSSDVGERPGPAGLADDFELLRIITSANVACGGHAGDRPSMRVICEVAVANGVAVGAQVSYVDREGFGRRRLDVRPTTLVEQLRDQWGDLADAAATAGTAVAYMRPHGALYNAALVDADVATAVLDATPAGTPVLCLAGTVLALLAAERGHPVAPEVFADRAVTDEGLLVPRGSAGAVIEDPSHVARRLADWLRSGHLTSHSGRPVRLVARSICVHSDTPGAVRAAAGVREALLAAGARLRPFARPGATPSGAAPAPLTPAVGPMTAMPAAVSSRPTSGTARLGFAPHPGVHHGSLVHQYGERAVLIDAIGITPTDLTERARRTFDADLIDAIPAAACVLLSFATPTPADRVAALLQVAEATIATGTNAPALPPRPRGAPTPSDPGQPLVTIDVRYDGPDLADVARTLGTTIDDVVALHSGTEFDVAFFGFSPGFAYLTGMPERLHLPRRATPRPRVPAGAVAIAAAYSAVYPRESPGGWHLIGRTDAMLFDASRNPPSPLTPGSRVRFRPI